MSAAGDRGMADVAGPGGDRLPAQIATSPAVGVFQPGPKAVAGTRVRAGDRLGVVDMLGVPQEVVAPLDGIVVGVIVDGGTAVEYGQELVHLEPAVAAEGR
jgi:biotin carboxyl carrier protein